MIGVFIEKYKKYESLDFINAIGLIVMQLFEFIHPVVPLSVLIAIMMTFWKMTRTSEMVVIRGSGMSVWGILRPFITCVFVIGLLDIFVLNPFTVYLNKKVEVLHYKYGISAQSPFALSEKGFWLREKKEDGYNILYADKIKQVENKLYLNSIIIFYTDFDHNFVKRVEATTGVLDNYSISFKNVKEIAPGKKIVSLKHLVIPTQLSIQKIKDTYASTDIISFWELPGLISFFKDLGFSVRRQVSYFLSLLIFPLFLVSFVLIGACFSLTTQPRGTKFFAKMSLGIGCGFIAYFMDQIVSSMGASGGLPVILGVIGIPMMAIFFSVWGLFYLEEG